MLAEPTQQMLPQPNRATRPTSFLVGSSARRWDRPELAARVGAGLATASRRLHTELELSYPLSGKVVLGVERDTWGAASIAVRSAESSACAVLFGELHDRRELEASLGEGRGLSDVELVLRAWRSWGARAVDRLLGDYAFFTFDDRGRSFAAVSPGLSSWLFYRIDSDSVRFATHPLLLLGDDSVAALDTEYFARSFFVLTGNLTPFQSVKFLRPGHALEVDARSVREYRFWWPPASGTIRHRTDADYRHHLRSLLTEAVRCRLERRPRATICLSAGIDSGSIAACAADLVRTGRVDTRLTCLTYGRADVPRGDESPFAVKVAQRLGLPHQTVAAVRPTREQLLDDAVRLGVPTGHLFLGDGHAALAERTASLAGGGPGYALDGAAGEILMSDFTFLVEAVRGRRVLELARQLPLVAKMGVRRTMRELLGYVREDFTSAFEPARNDDLAWLRVLPPRFASDTTVHPSARSIEALVVHTIGASCAYGMAAWRGRGSMSVSPYADARVQEFAYGIPVAMRMSPTGEAKTLARNAFPEVSRDTSAEGARVVLNEDMAVSWIGLGEAAWLERALQELPPTLREVIDVAMVRQRLPDLRDPAKATTLFDVVAIVFWVEALRERGVELK